MESNGSGGYPLMNQDVVVILKTGFKRLGVLRAMDSAWVTIEYQGERQLIPIGSIDTIEKARA